jgi:transcriptional regulator with XRE-family HTH domain
LAAADKIPEPMDIALGAAIRIRRRTLGLSQDALAEKCGVTFQQVQKYENGANRISFSRLVQISAAVLDGPDAATAQDLDLLTRVRIPGAVELLDTYARLPQAARTTLVGLVRALTPETGVRGSAAVELSATPPARPARATLKA